MKIILFFFLHFLLINTMYGQDDTYKHTYSIEQELKQENSTYRFQMAANYYSFINEYKKTLQVIDRQFEDDEEQKLSGDQETFLKDYKPSEATKVIVEQAKKHKIIIFNEAHYLPLHRSYVASILNDLKKIGYVNIGLEALNYEDKKINKRGYPTINSGYYTAEPQFGNFIRKAISLGFKVFPYEDTEDSSDPKNRELNQAKNILQAIKKKPDEKFIIFCGFDHVIEDTITTKMAVPMAARLKEITGLDPLTIDQVELTERSNVRYENPYRRSLNFSFPAILFKDHGQKTLSKVSERKTVDFYLYHPNTTYVNGRPAWVMNESSHYFDIRDSIKIKYPCLVKAYLKDEIKKLNQAIPVDVFEILDKNDNKHLIIPKKKNIFVIVTNPHNEVQKIELYN